MLRSQEAIMDIGLAVLRIIFGAFVAAHGFQKLTYFWGGGGLAASSAEFRHDGFRGGKVTAFIAAGTQLAAGVALMIGFLTPIAAAGTIAVMTIATMVKLRAGFWSQNGGFEYPILLTALGIVIAFTGPGRYSIDALLGLSDVWSLWVSLAAAVAGILGALGTNLVLKDRSGRLTELTVAP
jgi:putative oxidoreductase